MAQTKAFASPGGRPNQVATGGGLDSLAAFGALVQPVLAMPDDATASAASDQLSGEIHASAETALLEDSRLVRDVTIGHLLAEQDQGKGASIWGQGVGS